MNTSSVNPTVHRVLPPSVLHSLVMTSLLELSCAACSLFPRAVCLLCELGNRPLSPSFSSPSSEQYPSASEPRGHLRPELLPACQPQRQPPCTSSTHANST